MAYLIPIFLAYATYLYNYRRISDIKKEIIKLQNMNENDKWLIGELAKITNKIGTLSERLKAVETTQKIYFGSYSLLSIALFLLTYFKK